MHPGKRVEGKIKRRPPVPREQTLKLRPIAPKTSIQVKTAAKYQCTLCDRSFIKGDNFTVSKNIYTYK